MSTGIRRPPEPPMFISNFGIGIGTILLKIKNTKIQQSWQNTGVTAK